MSAKWGGWQNLPMLSSSSRCWHNADRCLLVEGWKVFGYWGGRRITEAQKKCPTIEKLRQNGKNIAKMENTRFFLQIWGFFRAEVLNLALLQICWAKKSKWDSKSFGCFRNVNLIMPLHPCLLCQGAEMSNLRLLHFPPFNGLNLPQIVIITPNRYELFVICWIQLQIQTQLQIQSQHFYSSHILDVTQHSNPLFWILLTFKGFIIAIFQWSFQGFLSLISSA